jgi:Putative Actinobacterial Holin-X, holin superfamily III
MTNLDTGSVAATREAEEAARRAATGDGVGPAVQEISRRAQLLVREEIELAKTEITAKVMSLVRGIAIGVAAGMFASIGLLFFLHGLAWGFYDWLGVAAWVGFWITAGILFLLAAIAAFLAARFVRGGSPPKPEMAIDEAQRIKQTVDEARR